MEDASAGQTTFSILLYKKTLPTPEIGNTRATDATKLLREHSTHEEQLESTQEKS